jgi:hypothetical protein
MVASRRSAADRLIRNADPPKAAGWVATRLRPVVVAMNRRWRSIGCLAVVTADFSKAN